MAKLDESGMASLLALAAVCLLLSGTAALLVLSEHNRLAAKEAVQATRLLESSRSAVRLGAAQLEKRADLRRQAKETLTEVEVVSDQFEVNDAFYRVTARRLPQADTKDGEAYLLTALSWQRAEAGSAGQEAAKNARQAAEPAGKRAYAAALYCYEGERLLFLRWEK